MSTEVRKQLTMTTQEVVGVLRAAGFVASISVRSRRRNGYSIVSLNRFGGLMGVLAENVENLPDYDHLVESTKMMEAVRAAGYDVQRPDNGDQRSCFLVRKYA